MRRALVGEPVQYFTTLPDEQLWAGHSGPYAAIVTAVREGSLIAVRVFPPFGRTSAAAGWIRHARERDAGAERWWGFVWEGQSAVGRSAAGQFDPWPADDFDAVAGPSRAPSRAPSGRRAWARKEHLAQLRLPGT